MPGAGESPLEAAEPTTPLMPLGRVFVGDTKQPLRKCASRLDAATVRRVAC
jgi:hypothetical protein